MVLRACCHVQVSDSPPMAEAGVHFNAEEHQISRQHVEPTDLLLLPNVFSRVELASLVRGRRNRTLAGAEFLDDSLVGLGCAHVDDDAGRRRDGFRRCWMLVTVPAMGTQH